MKKILFVTARYGLEINGGAELHARKIAEELSRDFVVDVLTTKAIDHNTFANEINEDEEMLNGIRVIRKKVSFVKKNKFLYAILPSILIRLAKFSRFFEKLWIELEGPQSRDLLAFYKKNKDSYDAVVFIKSFAWTTYKCIQLSHRKKILVPLVHDDPIIRLNSQKKVFQKADFIQWNSTAEKEIALTYITTQAKQFTAGIWALSQKNHIQESKLRKKYGIINNPFILYVGRIESGKGADTLFKYFADYKKFYQDDQLKLVLVGKSNMQIPKHKDIVYAGFVSEEERDKLIEISKAVMIPSKFESLSMILLEALNLETPCIVNAKCNALFEHSKKAQGVFAYSDFEEFCDILSNLNDINIKKPISDYVKNNYSKEFILGKWKDMIEDAVV